MKKAVRDTSIHQCDRVRVSGTRAPHRGRLEAWLSVACLLLALSGVASTAEAQSASFRSVDTNRDGVLSFAELVAAFGREGALRLLRTTDFNGDNQITIRELRQGATDDTDGEDPSNRQGDQNDDDDGDDGGDDGDDD